MELIDAIIQRRSIRRYTDERVPKEVIDKIVQAGIWAPSACNVQGWRFIILDDKKIIDQILQHGGATFLANAYQAILVLYNNQTDNIEYKDHIQSASACIQNMLLQAHELNVGTCWVNYIPRKRVLKKLFSIPFFYEPIALVSLGYYDPLKIHEQKRKQTASECIAYNHYDFTDEPIPFSRRLALSFRRFARKMYFILPFKRLINKKAHKYEKKFEN